MKRILIPIAFIALLSTGCAKAVEHLQDAHVSNRDTGPAEVINMPDGFGNAATKCNHGNRIYTLFHNTRAYGGVAVVSGDPSCK